MIRKERLRWLNISFWLASMGAMTGMLYGGDAVSGEGEVGLPAEFLIISAITLESLWLISGKKTFTILDHETGCTVKMLLVTLIFPGVFALFGTSWRCGTGRRPPRTGRRACCSRP